MGKKHAGAIAGDSRAELAAVCDMDAGALKEVQEATGAVHAHTDYRELLSSDDIDAVHIALPDHLHTEVTVDALRSGKDVLLEKPMATSTQDAELIAEAASGAGRIMMVNFSNRWMAAFRKIKKSVREGQIGKILFFSGTLSNTLHVPGEMLSWGGHSSPTFFLLSHVADIARWLIEDEISSVYALKTEGVLSSRGLDTHDTMTAALKFSGGAASSIDTAWVLPESLPRPVFSYYRIIGTEGFIVWDRHNNKFWIYGSSGLIHEEDYEEPEPGFFELSVRHFISCLNGEETPVGNETDGLANTRALCGIIESANTGKIINL